MKFFTIIDKILFISLLFFFDYDNRKALSINSKVFESSTNQSLLGAIINSKFLFSILATILSPVPGVRVDSIIINPFEAIF